MKTHFSRMPNKITACGFAVNKESLFSTTPDVHRVDCARCKNTVPFKNARNESARTEGVMPSTETVGIPTQPETMPLVHMAFSSKRPEPWCPAHADIPNSYSTIDLDAVNCADCLNSGMYRSRRELQERGLIDPGKADPLAEYMGAAEPDYEPIYEGDVLNEDEAFTAEAREAGWTLSQQEDRHALGRDHDAPHRPHPHKGIHKHDCDQCFFLGTDLGQDLYWCRQSTGQATVIARYGDHGDEYRSGLWAAKDDRSLALAVVRAIHRGLLTAEDLSNI